MRIRDAVVGDITIGRREELCIRTPTFQRLHRIKQLGNAFHVYPSAMHTRFEHSLGVYYQIEKLFSQPDFFGDGVNQDKEKMSLVKLAGLLHDVVHTPFRHTLERDAAILPAVDLKEDYRERIEKINREGDIGINNGDLDFIVSILSTEDASVLPEPYYRQLIEDTLSADLLDYTLRDSYFTTGWRLRWDERVYDHIAVAIYSHKPCIVAKIIDEFGNIAASAITELTNLLYIRYVLNERVYFYPVKIAADSLLIKSIRCLFKYTDMKPETFRNESKDFSDEELINYLISSDISEVSQVRYYANLLKDRNFPKMVCAFSPHDITPSQKDHICGTCRGNEALDAWDDCEKQIAEAAGVDSNNIFIYCHSPEMQAKKGPDFLIMDDRLEPFPVSSHSAHPRMSSEIEAIAKKQEDLWRCYVFSQDRDDSSVDRVKSAAQDVLKGL